MSATNAPQNPALLTIGTQEEGNTKYVVDVGDDEQIIVYASWRDQAAVIAGRAGYTVFNVTAAEA